MKILAIETSCDETAIAVVDASGGLRRPRFRVLSNIVASQIHIHKKWGGVVPNLAKREHEKNLVPALQTALDNAKILIPKFQKQNSRQTPGSGFQIPDIEQTLAREPELFNSFKKHIFKLASPKIDVIAVTNGPGLEPALWVGINFAKALALIWKKPLIAVNHMEGHLASVLLSQNRGISNSQFFRQRRTLLRGAISKQIPNSNFPKRKSEIIKIGFPAVALLVSGGHTELLLMKNWRKYRILGTTLDDAAGEAFDKVARMLGLGYPGGPIVARLAKSGEVNIPFPRPMLQSKNLDFSFSGLKTAVLYFLQKQRHSLGRKLVADISASFQQAVVDVLVAKTVRAARAHKPKTIILGGGVAANDELRMQLAQKFADQIPGVQLLLPQKSFTGDNAAMIGAAAYFRAVKKEFANLQTLKAKGNLRIR